MAVAIAIWSLDLTPGQPQVIVPQADIRISNATLGEKLADQNGRTVVKLTYDNLGADGDEEEDTCTLILCALTAGKVENAQVTLVLEEGSEYKLEVSGKNPVSLSGNYIDQVGPDQEPFSDEEDSEPDSDEEGYDLREVSSDVEMDPNELDFDSDANRFEEVEETIKETKSSKRTRDSDAAEQEKPTKAEKKNKKLKKDNGEAVPVAQEKETAKSKDDKPKKVEKKDEKKDEKLPKEKELAGGLKIKDAAVGTGPQAKKGDRLQMRYVGKLQNGKVFDKNTKGSPFGFRLGAGEVIKGWDEGLVGMQVGGERLLTIPPQLAYGKRGSKPDIPANATLIFEVKLLAIN